MLRVGHDWENRAFLPAKYEILYSFVGLLSIIFLISPLAGISFTYIFVKELNIRSILGFNAPYFSSGICKFTVTKMEPAPPVAP